MSSTIYKYYLGGELRNQDSLNGANQLFSKAIEEYGGDLTGDALLISGRLFSENAQWEDAIEAYNLDLDSGKFSLLQELSVLLSKAQAFRHNNDIASSLNIYQSIKRKALENTTIISELVELDEKPSSEYHNSLYTVIVASYLESIDVMSNEGAYQLAAEANLEFLKWFDSVHPSQKYYKADISLGLDHGQSIVMKSYDLYSQAGMHDEAMKVVDDYLDHWTINTVTGQPFEVIVDGSGGRVPVWI